MKYSEFAKKANRAENWLVRQPAIVFIPIALLFVLVLMFFVGFVIMMVLGWLGAFDARECITHLGEEYCK